jgi:hypothetical protein
MVEAAGDVSENTVDFVVPAIGFYPDALPVSYSTIYHVLHHPTPNPSPQGGGERTEFAGAHRIQTLELLD